MPELPDVVVYIEALAPRILGKTLQRIRLASPFLLRTIAPAPAEAGGRTVLEVRRVGKRIAIGLEGELWLVIHLTIAGRLHWRPPAILFLASPASDYVTGHNVVGDGGFSIWQ